MTPKPTDLIFKMEHQFTLYLQRAGVNRQILPDIQLQEMRRAFYGGLGQMFFLLQDAGKMKERDCVQAMESIVAEIAAFWEGENVLEIELLDADSPAGCCDCSWTGKIKELEKPAESGGICQCPKCKSQNIRY